MGYDLRTVNAPRPHGEEVYNGTRGASKPSIRSIERADPASSGRFGQTQVSGLSDEALKAIAVAPRRVGGTRA